MRKNYLIILIFISKFLFSQTTNQIINIPDTLSNEKEIRIYDIAEITNYSELFRIYQATDKKWNVEYYKCYRATNEKEKSRYEKVPIIVKNDFDLLWLKILNTNIDNLPNWDKIKYKLKKKGEITIERGEYELNSEQVKVMDGESSIVMIRNKSKLNIIAYSNPETYFKYYPEVDELNSFVELLNLLRTEFDELKK